METTWRAAVATFVALLFGFGLMQMGNTWQATLLSVRGGMEDFSPAQIGLVGGGFWLGVVTGSLRCERLIRRVGHIRTFLALGAIASTPPLLHLLVMDPTAWIAIRALTGFCFAGLFIVVESWRNGAVTTEHRGQALSIYGMTGLLAGIVGQLLLSAVDPAGFKKAFCIVAIIIASALVPIALTRAESPPHNVGDTTVSLKGLYRLSPFGAVAAFLCGGARSRHGCDCRVYGERHGGRIHHDLPTGLAI
jgi:MFS family permease